MDRSNEEDDGVPLGSPENHWSDGLHPSVQIADFGMAGNPLRSMLVRHQRWNGFRYPETIKNDAMTPMKPTQSVEGRGFKRYISAGFGHLMVP